MSELRRTCAFPDHLLTLTPQRGEISLLSTGQTHINAAQIVCGACLLSATNPDPESLRVCSGINFGGTSKIDIIDPSPDTIELLTDMSSCGLRQTLEPKLATGGFIAS